MGTIASLSKAAIKPNPTPCKNQKKIVCHVIPQKKTTVFVYVSWLEKTAQCMIHT
jgi:hypothetical protein